jgi:putative transposase
MRRPRLELPGVPLHVTHRGVNRAATFLDDDDCAAYMHHLHVAANTHRVDLHAYVLMTNHVHLLVSSHEAGAVSRTMQALGRRYVRGLNARHGRTGTLWEGRFKSCLVDTDGYVLRCQRYIELNPVRAAMTDTPEAHRWSSVHAHLDLRTDARLAPHPCYLALGADPATRAARYRELLLEPLNVDDLAAIRDHIRQERALGSPLFQAMVERALNRPAVIRPSGRPRKPVVDNSNGYVL